MNQTTEKVTVGIIGSGAISDIYLKNLTGVFSEAIRVKAVASAHLENAQRKAAKYGIGACTVEELLGDDEVEMVINLTPAHAHYEIIKKALEAGKHVYTEKTMTDSFASARELADLAKEKGLRLGCAPDTFLGGSFQTARKLIDEGEIGEVTSFAMAANRDNTLLTSLFSFLRAPGGGVGFDYSVYYLTTLVSILGGIERVGAMVRTPFKTHVNVIPDSPLYGQVMDTPNESEISAVIRLSSSVTGTFHVNADSALMDQAYFAIYGTKGILYLPDPNQFGGELRLLRNNWMEGNTEDAVPAPVPLAFSFVDNSRGLGATDMALSLREGRPFRTDCQMGLHVLEALEAILQGGEEGSFLPVTTRMVRPQPLQVGTGISVF